MLAIVRGACLLMTLGGAAAQASNLVDIYTEALGSAPRLQVADAEVEIFAARERYQRGALLPQASISAQGTRNVREGGSGASNREHYYGEKYTFSLSQALYDRPAWAGYRAARSDADEYVARYEDVENAVTVDVVERYTQVLAAEDNLRFVNAQLKAAEEHLQQVRARYERQLSMVTEVLEVEARRDRLLSDQLAAENQVALAREAVSELIGRELVEPVAPLQEEVFIPWQFDAVGEWLDRGFESNQALVSARHAVKSAQAKLQEARGGRHPRLNVQLMAQESDIGYENTQIPRTETYVAALNLTVPVLSGGQVTAKVAEARAQLRLAEQRQEETERALRKQIRESFLRTRNALLQVEATRKAVESAEKSYEAQQRGFQYGTVTVVDVLDASEMLYMSLRDYRQAYYDLMVQSMELFRAAESAAPERIVALNEWLATPEPVPEQ